MSGTHGHFGMAGDRHQLSPAKMLRHVIPGNGQGVTWDAELASQARLEYWVRHQPMLDRLFAGDFDRDLSEEYPVTIALGRPVGYPYGGDDVLYVWNGNHRMLASALAGIERIPVVFNSREAHDEYMRRR